VLVRLAVGNRARSAVSPVEVVVVHAPPVDVDLRCGGRAMTLEPSPPGDEPIVAGYDGRTERGRRYLDDRAGLEVICVVAGRGILSVGDALMGPSDPGGVREPRRPGPGAPAGDDHVSLGEPTGG
jgi:hypothetical protein